MSATSRPSARRSRFILLALILIALVASFFLLGPRVAYVVRKALRPPATAVVPRQTSVMFTLNLERLRSTPIWSGLLKFMKSSSDAEAAFKNLEKGTGFNPLEEVDTVVGAFPPLDAGTGGEFGLVMYGKAFKAERLEAWSRAELKKDNKELMTRDYKGHKLLYDSSKPRPLGTFYNYGTLLFGGDKWIEQMIDLEAQPAKAPPEAVIPLLAEVKRDWIFWGAGLIPEFVREKIRADGNFPAAASVRAAYLSVDFEEGLKVAGGAILGTEADALGLVMQLKQIQDLFKGSDQVQMAGLVPVFDAIKFDSRGTEVTVDIHLAKERLDDLFDRVKGMLSAPPRKIPSSLPPQSGAMPQLPFLSPGSLPGLGGFLQQHVAPPPAAPSP